MNVDVLQDINVSLHNPTKKAWRKSLRHAPIKENLIVKIEISYSSGSPVKVCGLGIDLH